MSNCIFCKIAQGEIPCYKVYEDEVCLAFLDLSQAGKGHTLIIPKQHSTNLLDTDSKIIAHMMSKAKDIANLLMVKLNAEGMNILSNANEAAGQSVMHFHIHLIPRYKNDDLVINFTDHQADTDFSALLNQIKN